MHIYHNFFIHSSVDGHLGCSHVLAVGISAAVNIGSLYLFELIVLSGYMPGMGFLDHGTFMFLVSLKNLHTVRMEGILSYISFADSIFV